MASNILHLVEDGFGTVGKNSNQKYLVSFENQVEVKFENKMNLNHLNENESFFIVSVPKKRKKLILKIKIFLLI